MKGCYKLGHVIVRLRYICVYHAIFKPGSTAGNRMRRTDLNTRFGTLVVIQDRALMLTQLARLSLT